MGTVQRADPKARRIALWVTAIAAVIGLTVILVLERFRDRLQSWLERNLDFLLDNTAVTLAVALALAAPVFIAGFYFLRLGNRTIRAQRFPPPGYALTRDTLVLDGWRGIRRGRILQLLALGLLSGGAVILAIVWRLFRTLGAAG